jgi:outer membrane lipoprotein-sorting protein
MSRYALSLTANRAVLPWQSKAALFLSILFCLCIPRALVAADAKTARANLSAVQVVEKHVAARGGLQAWRAVQTLSVSGTLDAGSGDSTARSIKLAQRRMGATAKKGRVDTTVGADKGEAIQQVQLPFTLDMKRPRKSRLEIIFAGKTAVQVYDGTNGWKLRPYLNRNDVEPFTAEEAKSETAKADIEGPLVDYAAKGTKVELAAVERVEGHDAYKLKLTMKNGDVQHIWIDAQSFLDVKIDGLPRRMDGRMRNVWIYQRDFRSVQGLMMPYVLETAVEGVPQTHKMTIQSVAVNRALDDSRFAKPQVLVAGLPTAAAENRDTKR